MSPIHSNKRSSVWDFLTRVPHPTGSCTLGGPSLTSQSPDEQRAILQQLFDELVGSLQLDLVTLQSLPEIRAVQIRIAELQSGQPHGPGAAAASCGGYGVHCESRGAPGSAEERRGAPGSAGERGRPGPARRAQCSCPEAGRRLRALSPGLIVARSHRGGGEAAGCTAEQSLLVAPLAGGGDSGARLAGGAPRRLGPAGKPAPCAERTRAGLQLPGRPSSALSAPRCPRPVPARSLP